MTRNESTDVTYEDIVLWKKRIKQAKDAESPEDLVKVVGLMANDMCFLVALGWCYDPKYFLYWMPIEPPKEEN